MREWTKYWGKKSKEKCFSMHLPSNTSNTSLLTLDYAITALVTYQSHEIIFNSSMSTNGNCSPTLDTKSFPTVTYAEYLLTWLLLT